MPRRTEGYEMTNELTSNADWLPLPEPAAWAREWEGDVSDIGHMIFTNDRNETEDGKQWEPLVTLEAARAYGDARAEEEREKWADTLLNMAAVSWAEWDTKADPIDQGKALALEHVAGLLCPNLNEE